MRSPRVGATPSSGLSPARLAALAVGLGALAVVPMVVIGQALQASVLGLVRRLAVSPLLVLARAGA